MGCATKELFYFKNVSFTLAIPNCIDMTGIAKEYRKSLADMMYTEIFMKGRLNLYDRDELANLNTDWIIKTLKDTGLSSIASTDEKKKGNDEQPKKGAEGAAEYVISSTRILDYTEDKIRKMKENLEKIQMVF